jgi:predicted AAA-ATPase
MLKKFLNSSLETFYNTYAAYLGSNIADLRQMIDSNAPNLSLERCAELVRNAIQRDDQLASIEGIYVLVDEYDAFQNSYLEPPEAVSLSNLGSGFNVARNLSFHKDLAGLCGLTYSDLKGALDEICKDHEIRKGSLSEMTQFFNGYHFCKDTRVETVYNTETCFISSVSYRGSDTRDSRPRKL